MSMNYRVMRLIFWVACWCSLAAGALASANHPVAAETSAGKSASPPNIILITLDTTRADRMGFLGSKRGLTPNLDALAKQSAVFERAYAQVPLTTGSHATILTGTYPQFHLVNDFETPLAADLPYAPEILKAHGYHTAAFLGSIILEAKVPYAPGFDRGFDVYDSGFHNDGPGQDRYKTVQRRGSEVVAHALRWLKQNRKGPFFIWIHVYDAHDPYDPPEPYKSRYKSEPYDGGIAYEDAVMGTLFREMKARGLYDGAVIAVMADHGESLGAHGEERHGIFLYDETIRVPLVIKQPHATVGGKQIGNRVALTDVMPTLLEEAGVAIPKEVQGQSLLGLMKADAVPNASAEAAWHNRPVYAQSLYPHTEFRWSALRSMRTDRYLYIQAPRRELYDQTADPGAEHNLAASSSAVTDTLAAQTEAFRQKTSSTRDPHKLALDLASQEQLSALGYVASSGSRATNDNVDQGADPKDKILIADELHRAQELQQDTHYQESIVMLEDVLAKEPNLPFYSKLGLWLMRQKEFEKAIQVFRKALQVEGDSTGTHFQLAKSLMETGDFDGAIPELESLIKKIPNAVEAHSSLELAYARMNRLSDAIRECKTVLEYTPEDYGSYLILGQSLARSGDLQAGVEALKKAASIQPEVPVAHAWLAEIYDQLGQKADAERERAEAEHLQPKGD